MVEAVRARGVLPEAIDENGHRGRVRSGAQAIVETLEAYGVRFVFGMCGHTNLAMLGAIEQSSLTFIGVRHEQVAAHAADGYFRATGELAAVLTTIGPGLTNALTGIGDAALDGAGMVVVAGDVPSYLAGRGGFQELDLHGEAQQVEMVRPLVKRAWKVASREGLADIAGRACQVALADQPGPVLLDVPMNFFSATFSDEIHVAAQRLPADRRRYAAEGQVSRVARMLIDAERPVVYAGGGAARSGARDSLVALAEHLGVPVVTTMSGQGAIPQDHRLCAGYTATVGTPLAHQLVNSADVVLALGTRFGEMETSSYDHDVSFRVPPTQVVQVDLDATQIGRAYPVAVGVVAEVGAFVEQLLGEVRAATPRRDWESSARFATIRDEIRAWRADIAEARRSDATPIAVERLLGDIREVLPRDGIFLTDVGIRHQVAQQFDVYEARDHYVASGWGTMGGSVAAALGAKVGAPDRAVVAEVGDGAFTSILSAVITAVEHDIPVVWVVMNNFGYSSISVYQHKHRLGALGTTFRTPDGQPYNPDFAALAAACGALGAVVTDPADLKPALRAALDSGRPYVLDVHTEPAPRTRASGRWDVNDILSGNRNA
ncbi:thiamine pyrophosphate-binding protein [Micromonospora craniellae]|uniref:Thiamine pyrophosphate-binding protein n=1 Tax=Micromonospora craniellae TaxID=2294034 RepID=A0A372FSZ8_9ACTN|nr:thiamine pyrophosphate-binding protein [Micromonospora craniellae]QOC92288.1 thiamine pyrophosphate-binding protein [Micromonospora craniellae]RFS43639.1 thiamine pyrophosphate-binding protein [Micromonospora craniellae]